ncbi:MbnP family copper-binding protein [Gemmatimonas sp.]
MLSFILSLAAATMAIADPARAVPAHGARTPTVADSLVPVTIRVHAMVGNEPFECGRRYTGIGTTGATITASEFRFYVHNVRLVNARGDTVAAALQPLAPWQDRDVALVDVENGAGSCSGGTPEMHPEFTVLAPAGAYRGVLFTLGVPFPRNHGDLAAQPAPLSLSRLFWSWNGGYKFLRVDMRASQGDSAATGWVIHLGSTGCSGAAGAKSPTNCTQPNRADIALANFDPSRDVVVADLAALLSRSDVRRNQPQTALGCMSAPNDADCGGLFASLGLAHPASTGSDTPRFFRVGKGAAAVRTSGAR